MNSLPAADLQRRRPGPGRARPARVGRGADAGRAWCSSSPSSPASSSEGAASHDRRRPSDHRDRRSTEMPTEPPTPAPSRAAARRGLAAVATAGADGPRVDGRRSPLRDLNAYYGDTHAIKGVDHRLRAQPGDGDDRAVGLRQVDACVRCINRMHEEIPGARAEGEVTLDDVDIYAASVDVVAVRRAIGMVFQKPNPFPTMSIFDNVAAGLRLTGARPRHARARRAVAASAPACGTRSRTASASRASASPAASSSACASRARSPSSPRSSSWTSRARRWTRSPR